MAFKKGQSGNPKGRPKGAQNKLTKTFKELIEGTLESLGPDHLLEWAKSQPGQFYSVAAKLIPSEVQSSLTLVPETRTYEEIRLELTQKHGEPMALFMLGEITQGQLITMLQAQQTKQVEAECTCPDKWTGYAEDMPYCAKHNSRDKESDIDGKDVVSSHAHALDSPDLSSNPGQSKPH